MGFFFAKKWRTSFECYFRGYMAQLTYIDINLHIILNATYRKLYFCFFSFYSLKKTSCSHFHLCYYKFLSFLNFTTFLLCTSLRFISFFLVWNCLAPRNLPKCLYLLNLQKRWQETNKFVFLADFYNQISRVLRFDLSMQSVNLLISLFFTYLPYLSLSLTIYIRTELLE